MKRFILLSLLFVASFAAMALSGPPLTPPDQNIVYQFHPTVVATNQVFVAPQAYVEPVCYIQTHSPTINSMQCTAALPDIVFKQQQPVVCYHYLNYTTITNRQLSAHSTVIQAFSNNTKHKQHSTLTTHYSLSGFS